MQVCKLSLILLFTVTVFMATLDCQRKTETKVEINPTELAAEVPALDNLHEAIYSLWHDAYPEKNYTLMKDLLPQLDTLVAGVESAQLPGILRDRQTAWDEGKATLKSSLAALHQAVEQNNNEAMLIQAEALHSAFERLMRIVRPRVAELESFHQELYKLYHYYMPNFELENIRATVGMMQEKLIPLKQAQLPPRLAEHQSQFEQAVLELETALTELSEIAKDKDRQTISAAVEKVHTAYQKAEAVFE